MSKTVWIIFAAVCVLLLGTLVALSNGKKVDVSNVNTGEVQTATEQSGNIADHVFGNADSKVILVEYGDFQCPGCGGAHPTVKALSEKYEDEIAFVFRNFPLTSIHPNALAAAAAAEAAGLQGMYWEMHNKLFENQDAWSNISATDRTEFFANYAKELGLDVETFKTDLASEAVSKKISFDMALGKKAGATGTPAFYLNGEVIEQPVWSDPAKFEAAITDALKEKNIPLPEEEASGE
ncbi:MAG TPA: thioredoxin domain-containing protein [Candidatus Saccharimonadales bacterium]|nr:thioredoxin domain-containing protein [Candidatus Saccharimonadales bacterium]